MPSLSTHACMHLLKLANCQPLDSRRRQVGCVHRSGWHGRNRATVGPVGASRNCGREPQQRTGRWHDDVSGRRRQRKIARRAAAHAPIYFPTWPQILHLTPWT